MSYSHGLIDIADRLQRLEPESSVERDVMLCDQFVENVRDVHFWWDLKRRIEEDAAVGFLALRKVALRWLDEVERFNRTMNGLLRVLPAEEKWADHLKEVVHAYNVTPHGSTGYLPHYLIYWRDSRLPIDVLLGGEEPSCDGWVQQHQRRLHDAYAKAATQLNKS